MSFADDPELVATFRAEVEERLASMSTGLLQLEASPRSRPLVQALFRDAHTVKGSARMLGLDAMVSLAHRVEDLLAAVRDGRAPVRRELVDLLLSAGESLGRCLPGAEPPSAQETATLAAALDDALAGRWTSGPPAASQPPVRLVGHEAATAAKPVPQPAAPLATVRVAPALRVTATKVHMLLDTVEEAELGARRLERIVERTGAAAAETARWSTALRDAVEQPDLPPHIVTALLRLRAAGDDLGLAVAAARELAEDHRGRVAVVRERAMGLAMVPVRQLLAGHPALVRRLARDIGAEVSLVLDGEDVELDKRVLDAVADALTHLVTNAVDHGCEPPAARVAAGKPAACTVRVSARSGGGTVVLTVADDGRGVDEDRVRAVAVARGLLPEGTTLRGRALLALLFTPAFSTREEVTETSGRGVGLDAVRTAVEDVGGTVEMTSSPAGSTVEVTLPVSLGVLHCLLARAGGEAYAVPVTAVVETLSLRDVVVHDVGGAPMVVLAGEALPLLDLATALGATPAGPPRVALVMRSTERTLVWGVDALEGESEVVVKDLGGFLAAAGGVPGIAGATIDGDGHAVCLLDLREIAEAALRVGRGTARPLTAAPAAPTAPAAPDLGRSAEPARVLVVEDSVGVRELERAVLTAAGYAVTTCVDGLEAAGRLVEDPFDLVLSDVEMPGMDGFALTRAVRAAPGWEAVPVVLMTSLGAESDRRQGLEAGASAYLLKSAFEAAELVATVRRLVGR